MIREFIWSPIWVELDQRHIDHGGEERPTPLTEAVDDFLPKKKKKNEGEGKATTKTTTFSLSRNFFLFFFFFLLPSMEYGLDTFPFLK